MNIKNGIKTSGRVVELNVGGLNLPTAIKVEFEVKEKKYTVRETLKLKSEPIKLGFLTIGQRKRPKIGKVEIGDSLLVIYSPGNPARAHILGNDGAMNC